MISIHIPGSKSDTQRAIFVAALTSAPSTVHDFLNCEDSEVLIQALLRLGVDIQIDGNDLIIQRLVNSYANLNNPTLNLKNAGTAVRFISALSTIVKDPFIVTGNSYMLKRPMRDMVDALTDLGVACNYATTGFPPIQLNPKSGSTPPCITIDTKTSSQYLSGLLMVAPLLAKGSNDYLTISLKNPETNLPYVDMTLATMKAFGVTCTIQRNTKNKIISYQIPLATPYKATSYPVEGDWSSASYLYAASYITHKPFSIDNINLTSLQGDRIIHDIYHQFKATTTALSINMEPYPDIIPSVVAMAFHRTTPTTIIGVEKLRFKETDRIAVMTREFAKLGGKVKQEGDTLIIHPQKLKQTAPIDPSQDHRMAMAISVSLLPRKPIDIKNPACVAKSFPQFYSTIDQFTE